ncbi:MAG: hypothetical protein QM692_03410 [Thermomicrobiales bacterium]
MLDRLDDEPRTPAPEVVLVFARDEMQAEKANGANADPGDDRAPGENDTEPAVVHPRTGHTAALTPAEVEAAGLNPRLRWMRVACAGEPVEPSQPPADWDGTLPAGCCHRNLCHVLGPCPHALTRCVATPEGELQ